MKLLKFVITLALSLVVLSACVTTPALAPRPGIAATLVAMPAEGSLLIVALITAGVTWLLLQLSTALKLDLSGYTAPIVSIISPILITLLESYLGMIPPAFDNIVLTLIHLAVLIAASLGIYVTTGKVRAGETHNLLNSSKG